MRTVSEEIATGFCKPKRPAAEETSTMLPPVLIMAFAPERRT